MYCTKIEVSVVDWICLAKDRYRWRALVNSMLYPHIWINVVSSSGTGWPGRAVPSRVKPGYLITTATRFGSHC
jgi:hypothetical protein